MKRLLTALCILIALPGVARSQVENLDLLSGALPIVRTVDHAKGKCWTNIRAVQNAAELSLRRAYDQVEVIQSDDEISATVSRISARQRLPVFVIISVDAQRAPAGLCIGTYEVKIALHTVVLAKSRTVLLFEAGGYGSNSSNLNDYVRNFMQTFLDEVALEILRYRSNQ